MVRGRISQGNGKPNKFNSSDFIKELENNDDDSTTSSLPRGGSKKSYSLPSSKFYENDERESQTPDPPGIQPKRGRGRPRKHPINITCTVTSNEIELDSSIGSDQNIEQVISKNIENHDHPFNKIYENSNDNIISVIEIVDDSQDNVISSITENIIHDTEDDSVICESHIVMENFDEDDSENRHLLSVIDDENNKYLIGDGMDNLNDNDSLKLNLDNDGDIHSESIITLSSDESNFKNELLRDRGTPTSDCGGSAPSPDILHVHINPGSARTYENKRKSKTGDQGGNLRDVLDKNFLEMKDIHTNSINDEKGLPIDSMECRRSSRKKIMKYDVRDLLNKSRKKIQIEARIDSLPKTPSDKVTDEYFTNSKLFEKKLSLVKEIPKFNQIHEHIKNDIDVNSLAFEINDNQVSHETINRIQIENRNVIENGILLPVTPTLKPLSAELDIQTNHIPNGLCIRDSNCSNNLNSFNDYNSMYVNSTNSASQLSDSNQTESEIKTVGETVIGTSAIPPPVLSSMVTSPLLNIKFKRQNMANHRRSLDSFKSLTEFEATITNSLDKPTMNTTVADQTLKTLPDVVVKVKGKRGRPAKNKLLNMEIPKKITEPSSKPTKGTENGNNIKKITKSKLNKLIEKSDLKSTKTESKIKTKKNLSLNINETVTNEQKLEDVVNKGKEIKHLTNLVLPAHSTNRNCYEIIEGYKIMKSKVRIERTESFLSNRSSTESNHSNNDIAISDIPLKNDEELLNQVEQKSTNFEQNTSSTNKEFKKHNNEIVDTKAVPKHHSNKHKIGNIHNSHNVTSREPKKLNREEDEKLRKELKYRKKLKALEEKHHKRSKSKEKISKNHTKPSSKRSEEKHDKTISKQIGKIPKISKDIQSIDKVSVNNLASSSVKLKTDKKLETKHGHKSSKSREKELEKRKIDKNVNENALHDKCSEPIFVIESREEQTKLPKTETPAITLNREESISICSKEDTERASCSTAEPFTDEKQDKIVVCNENEKTEESIGMVASELTLKTKTETNSLEMILHQLQHNSESILSLIANTNILENLKIDTKKLVQKTETTEINQSDTLSNIIHEGDSSQLIEKAEPIDEKIELHKYDDEKVPANFIDNKEIHENIKKENKSNDFEISNDNLKLYESIEEKISDCSTNVQIQQQWTTLLQSPAAPKHDKLPKKFTKSSATESNDPLKDIEKFLEAAGNLLSRSLSSEDENDNQRRHSKTPSRLKDSNAAEDLDENIEERGNNSSFDEKDVEIGKKINTEIINFKEISALNLEDIKKACALDSVKNLIGKVNESNDQKKNELSGSWKNVFQTEKPIEMKVLPIQEVAICNDSLKPTLDDTNFSNAIETKSIEKIEMVPQLVNSVKVMESESQKSRYNVPEIVSREIEIEHEVNLPEVVPTVVPTVSQLVEMRVSGPRTPPLPNYEKSDLDKLNDDANVKPITDNQKKTIESTDQLLDKIKAITDPKAKMNKLKLNISKETENIMKLAKKLKKKEDKKLSKKHDDMKRTIKELKKIKKSKAKNNSTSKLPSTISKGALKSFAPEENNKTNPENQVFNEIMTSMQDNIDSLLDDQYNANIRRSHRIKTITKSQSQAVGRGLVRDKDFDDAKPDLAGIAAENAKFLKDMEERLSQFQVIRDNDYKCDRIISKEAKKMICDCFLTRDEEERGEFGCGEDCLNRLLMIECGLKCTVGDRCTNRRFQRAHYAPCKVFQTEKKGCGIMADAEIPGGEFIMEYVGEVLNSVQFEKRAEIYSLDKNKHYYFMALRSDAIIDATTRGNISRFINHSCDPNAETQKWTVNGELRIGFFTTRTIAPGEEITFDYQFQRYGKEAQKCYCESANCRGWIGEEPESDDDLEYDSEDEEKSKQDRQLLKEIKDDQESFKDKIDTDKENNVEVAKPATKIAKKEKGKRGRKRLDFRGKNKNEFLDDLDLEGEVLRLCQSGLKNQLQTLRLSRLIVRAKHLETRLNLLEILRNGEKSCRRLFLDYHGLKLLHGWMSETTELIGDTENDLKIRMNVLETLSCLPISNKTMLKDSKVFQTVQKWSEDKTSNESSPNNDSPNDNSNSGTATPISEIRTVETTEIFKIDEEKLIAPEPSILVDNPLKLEIKNMSGSLITKWDSLPEVFRIPRKERVEQMKEHEREADKEYAALKLVDGDNEIRRNCDRFAKSKDTATPSASHSSVNIELGSGGSSVGKYKWTRDMKSEIVKERRKDFEKSNQDGLSKMQRRQIFAAKVAQDEVSKRVADRKREFEVKCKFYGLDPLATQFKDFPFSVNPATGQWYTMDKRLISTPPSHAHIVVPPKPQSTIPEDYQLPPLDLPPHWKFAIDPNKGRIYYYHVKIRIPQWEPPIKILPLSSGSDGSPSGESPTLVSVEPTPSTSADVENAEQDENESSDSCSESSESGTEKTKEDKPELNPEQKKVERKRKRHALLVQERPISPRRDEDRVYNQIEMRRYKENKEKIRRRKEEIKRRKVQLAKQLTEADQQKDTDPNTTTEPIVIVDCTIADDDNATSSTTEKTESDSVEIKLNALPIADYLISSDEEDTIKNDCDAKLIDKIVQGEKIVDELDVLNINRPMKRLLSIKERSAGSTEPKKKIKLLVDDKKSPKIDDDSKKPKPSTKQTNPKYLARKAKEKFRSDIAGIIVLHLTPYRLDTCTKGRISNTEDFKHLARKLTHFVMVKELKHCDSTGQTLIVTDSVKNKSREFIKKYMSKYDDIYIRPQNDPEFKEIPH